VRYLRLLGVQLRISAASGMAYRSDFLLEGFGTVAWMFMTLLPLMVLFDGVKTVEGWDRSSALIVMGYFMGVRAVLVGLVSPSLTELTERIRTGAFDYVLLKPVDAQALISASRFEPWKFLELIGALVLIVYAFYEKGTVPSAGDIVLGAVLFVVGVIAMYALWIACAASAFWVVRLDNLQYLLSAIFDTARWPVQVFQGVWRAVFTFVIPVAVMTTYPAMALLGRLDAQTALATVGGALALLVVSRIIWKIAIRNYTSASS
jgi:ABC-2 type transport system permease protein